MKHFLFDLDGTLLPQDQKRFTELYFGALVKWFDGRGQDGKAVLDAMLAAVGRVVANDGKRTNEQVFWEAFCRAVPYSFEEANAAFEAFYMHDFWAAKEATRVSHGMIAAVAKLLGAGIRPILATNALFPLSAIRARLSWAGLNVGDFAFVTLLDNSHYCKPDPAYYSEILDRLGLAAEDTIMIGNDLYEDGICKRVGIRFALVTDCLLHDDCGIVPDFRLTADELPALIDRLLAQEEVA